VRISCVCGVVEENEVAEDDDLIYVCNYEARYSTALNPDYLDYLILFPDCDFGQ
jgi:hypothetical protein